MMLILDDLDVETQFFNSSEGKLRQLDFPSTLQRASWAREEIVAVLEHAGCGEREVFCVRTAAGEALANAVKHGNRHDASKTVTVLFCIDDEQIWIRIIDEGTGFSLDDVPDPTLPENLDRPCGRGLSMMRTFSDMVQFNDVGNMVTLVKYRSC